jgi:hypothetical protein
MKEWRYISMHSKPRNYTKLNGKTSLCGEEPPLPVEEEEAGWVSEAVWAL